MNLCNPEGWRNEVKSLKEKGDKDKFFTYFDGGGTFDGAYEKAQDVFNRLFLPYIEKHVKNTNIKTSLEIGYGTGFQTGLAANLFKKSYGVDVHDESDYIMESIGHLFNKGRMNFLVGDGRTIPLPNNSIDFVHSWCTFLHLVGWDNVEGYIKEIKRVLRSNGVGVIYFTRLVRSKSAQTMDEYQINIIAEDTHRDGYRYGGELTRVRATAIIISLRKMKDLLLSLGLEILDEGFSYDTVDGKVIVRGQHGIVFKKHAAKSRKGLRRKNV